MPLLLQQPTTPAQTTEAAAVPTTAIIGAVLAGVVALLLAGAFVRHKRLMWSLKAPTHDFALSTVPTVDHWPGPAPSPAPHNTSRLPSIPRQAEPSSVPVPLPSKDHPPCGSSPQSSNSSLESPHIQSADSINACRPIAVQPVASLVPSRLQDLGPPYQSPKVAGEGEGDTR